MTTHPNNYPPTTTLADYFTNVYARLKLAGRSATTKRLYGVTIRNFDMFLGRPSTLADLDDDTVTALMAWTMERGRSPRTANKHRDQLLALWRFAARKRHVEMWPDVEPIPEYKRIPQAWSMEEFQTILRACQETPGYVCGIFARLYWTALVLTLYDTGGRVGAVMQAKWPQVNLAGRTLHLLAETQKQRCDQVLTLHPQTVEALAAIATPARELVFPWDMAPNYRWGYYQRILKRAGLPTGPLNMFHRIRKTSATMLTIAVGSQAAATLLGHSSAKVTAKYIDTTKLPQDATADRLPRPDMMQVVNEPSPDTTGIRFADLLPAYLDTLAVHGVTWNGNKSRSSVKRFVATCGVATVGELTAAVLADHLESVKAIYRGHTAQDHREGVTWFLLWLVEKHGCHCLLDCLTAIGARLSHVRPPWRTGEAKGGAA